MGKTSSTKAMLGAVLIAMGAGAAAAHADPLPPEPVDALPAGAGPDGGTIDLSPAEFEKFGQTITAMLGSKHKGFTLPTEQAPRPQGAPAGSAGAGGESGKDGPAGVEEFPLAGYPLVTYKACGHTRLTPALASAMAKLQSGPDSYQTVTEAAALIQSGIDQVNQAVAARPATTVQTDKPLEPGNQYAAAVQAVKVAGQPNCTVMTMSDAVGAAQQKSSPILLDLNGNGVADVTTPHVSLAAGPFVEAGSVMFDIAGTGRPRRTEWLKPGQDGLLVLDTNGNGVVDSATELFGDADGYENGYAKLSILDRDGDGALTGAELSQLSVWVDDGDGLTQAGELRRVTDLGITRIAVTHHEYASSFVREGKSFSSWDWFPRTR